MWGLDLIVQLRRAAEWAESADSALTIPWGIRLRRPGTKSQPVMEFQ